jgi:uncharacterized protein YjbI with pentapeptide repeats
MHKTEGRLMPGLKEREKEIRLIWSENQWLYMVVGFLGGVVFCLLAQTAMSDLPEAARWLIPEGVGVFVTVVAVAYLNRRQDKRNAIHQLQEQLVREAGSMANDIAKSAVHELKKHNWVEFEGKLLSGADLSRANLAGADLARVNLAGTNFISTNLQGADLVQANLQNADLRFANLAGANLILANLQGANLHRANLQGANLWSANLQGAGLAAAHLQEVILNQANLAAANFEGANLQGAKIERAVLDDRTHFDEETILPDGLPWTPDTDMSKFTQPKPEADIFQGG